MTFQVEITPIAESQIEQAYRWYRERNPEFADCLTLNDVEELECGVVVFT